MAATKLNVLAPQLDLYKHIAVLKPDDAIILCQGEIPVAEIRLLPGVTIRTRSTESGIATTSVPESFFDPLPDELLDLFEGKTD